MTSRRAVLLVLTGVVLGACSDGEASDGTSSTDSIPATSAAATTDAPPVVTEPLSTGSSPSTTETTTTEAEPTTTVTTAAPATTTPSTPQDDIVQAVAFFEEQWKECLRTLPNCDTQAVIERRLGDEISTVQVNALSWNQNDYRATNIDALDYRVDGVNVDTAAGTAVVMVCVTDPVRLTEADGETIVDAEFYSSVQEWTMEFVDEAWGVASREIQGDVAVGEVANLCAV